MVRTVAIISEDDSLIESVKSALIRFEHEVKPVDRSKYLWPETAVALRSENITLIIVDTSSGFSPRELKAAALWSKTQKEIWDAMVLWIGTEAVERDYAQTVTDSTDATMRRDFIGSREWPKELVRLMYRKFKPGKTRFSDSEDTWSLMRARTASVITSELVQATPEARDREPSAMNLVFSNEFVSGLAERLIYDLPPLLWVYLSEELISKGHCELHGLGKFERSYKAGPLSVLFRPESAFARMLIPDLDFLSDPLSEEALVGVNLCFPHLSVALLEFVQNANRSVTSAFAELLLEMYRSFAASRMQHATTVAENQKALGVLAYAAVFAGYYTYVVSLRKSIQEQNHVSIPMIGLFSSQGESVDFLASHELLELIDANPMSITRPA
jgi:hypothetical protein